ncbi:MAG: ATP phosphoribosyltransferase [Thermotoga sp. 50_1627]|uniref:ATP phosphoribosyltransferase n=1 Tax=Pseudothermotoga sp. TaxID=2033661 RepID=UPI00076D664F|nr:MAG: ATP phosphoribosyltransferase [Thermotoga sp. 50_64]KUK24148.1 MAG: ATP phosphoribosyltransferase [Thermotoga sp. 50_1627]MBC7116189.1 ATP phosphoribosyltransferase [Pseudothermotoga sp.]MDK2923926.1 phosphoribosyltransferase [Pseudothermotoga sp.]HBT38787.1 ATP phosphoribosyltransferase [Pseudothermotoga sp.]
MVKVALAKGRLEDETFAFFKKCGFRFKERGDRSLIVEDIGQRIQIFIVKPLDVPTYVFNGVADAGICGTDSIVESQFKLVQPMKLPFGKARMVVAGLEGFKPKNGTIHVATKFPVSAKTYFESKGFDVKIIKLHGSVELAPIVGLAPLIVDIVQTGRTLKENGLSILEEVYPISAVVTLNDVAYRIKRTEILSFLERLKRGIEDESPR